MHRCMSAAVHRGPAWQALCSDLGWSELWCSEVLHITSCSSRPYYIMQTLILAGIGPGGLIFCKP